MGMDGTPALEWMDGQQVLAGFPERMAKIALFDPLFELQRKKQTDLDGVPMDQMELGLLTLLFFFEHKLMRNPKAGVAELAAFLARTVQDRYRLTPEGYAELARSIIQVFRPATGRKRAFAFYNWEARKEETVYTSILKASTFDAKANTQYYALDEDGLELIFATKEFYLEFQLSIHQLVLRKQLEKGEFQGALRQINEMRVDVEALQERMTKLAHEIRRSIVSEDTLKKYSGLLDDIYLRLQREHEEFEELRDFVRETRERVYSDRLEDKQHQAYEYILRIAAELEKVHGEHTLLLQRSMELKTGALQAAKESLYYTGMNSFNFEQDIASLIFGSPLPVEALRGALAPFLGFERHMAWSPLTVFAEQNIAGDGEEENREEGFLEAGGSSEDERYALWRGSRFRELMESVLERLEVAEEVLLSELVAAWAEDEGGKAAWLQQRVFYDFWLILHQRSPIRATKGQEDRAGGIEEAIALIGSRELVVQELPGIVQGSPRYAIQNMRITWGDRD